MFTNTIVTCTFSYCKVPSSQLHTRPGAKDFICVEKMRYLKITCIKHHKFRILCVNNTIQSQVLANKHLNSQVILIHLTTDV